MFARIPIIIMIGLLSVLGLGSESKVVAQSHKYSAIEDVLARHTADSTRVIELKATIYFNTLINDYRKSKGLHPLVLSDVLWLTSHNHNYWMVANNDLTHGEKAGTRHFTGNRPGDRLTYVKAKDCSWSNENALYNYAYQKGHLYNTDKIAFHIALRSFNQWRSSGGHNRNMLTFAAQEGTAFAITTQGKVYATSLFGYCDVDDDNRIINAATVLDLQIIPIDELKAYEYWHTALQKEAPLQEQHPSLSYKAIKYGIINTIDEELERKHYKSSSTYAKAATEHAAYMFAVQSDNLTQEETNRYFYAKDTKQRLLKASNGLALLHVKVRSPQEITFTKTYAIDYFSVDALRADVKEWLQGACPTTVQRAGYGLRFRKMGDELRVAISVITS